jgi:DNA-binding IclR family transcriptional regulator
MPRKPGTPVTVTGRVLAILDAFSSPSCDGLTLVTISERSGLPLSTTFRLVNELHAGRILTRDQDRRYKIGPRIQELAR